LAQKLTVSPEVSFQVLKYVRDHDGSSSPSYIKPRWYIHYDWKRVDMKCSSLVELLFSYTVRVWSQRVRSRSHELQHVSWTDVCSIINKSLCRVHKTHSVQMRCQNTGLPIEKAEREDFKVSYHMLDSDCRATK